VRFRTTSIADSDVAEAALWLEGQQLGLGTTFVDAIDSTFRQIRSAPLACPTFVLANVNFKAALRSRYIEGFSHQAIFTVQSDEVVVVAVLHPHRDVESILRSRVGTN
jgi:hypothetical protein